MAANLHLPHIEQLAAETGDVQLVKDIFNDVLNKLIGIVKEEVSITEKVDGVPLLFGKIGDEFFVGLKNRCLKNGKFVRSAAFFSPSDFSKAGGNAGLIENLYNNLNGVVSNNTVYFGELIFSTHKKDESDERKNKNQTLQEVGDGTYVTQPNLLWYKIKGVRGEEKLGILQIGTFKNVLTDSDLVENKIKYGKFDFSGNSDVFLTTGEVDLVIDSQNKTVTEIQKLVNRFNFSATKNFKIKEYVSTQYNTGQYKDVSKAKEKLLDLISTVRTVLGYKTVTETGKTGKNDVKVEFKDKDKVDEGVVVSTGEHKVKFISKNFFDYTVTGHYDKGKGKKTMNNESVQSTPPVVLFKGKFQPFHSGHYSVFKELQTIWGEKQVYISTSEQNKLKTKGKGSSKNFLPGNFEDKKAIIELYSGTKKFLINDTGTGGAYQPQTAKNILKEKTPEENGFVKVVWAIGEKDGERIKSGNTLQVYGPEDLEQKLKDPTTKSGKGQPLDDNTTFWTVTPTFEHKGVPLSATTIRAINTSKEFNVEEYKNFFPADVYTKLKSNVKAQKALSKIVGKSKEVQNSSYTARLSGLVLWN